LLFVPHERIQCCQHQVLRHQLLLAQTLHTLVARNLKARIC
jgi:hypothetical protein